MGLLNLISHLLMAIACLKRHFLAMLQVLEDIIDRIISVIAIEYSKFASVITFDINCDSLLFVHVMQHPSVP